MCRLTCVITSGQPLLLADILTRPRMGIIRQSFNCKERLAHRNIRQAYQQASLNGDGFGVGWYSSPASASFSSSPLADYEEEEELEFESAASRHVVERALRRACAEEAEPSCASALPNGEDEHDGRERVDRVAKAAASAYSSLASADAEPCVFTSLKPAWADRNLFILAEKIASRLIFAHVRAASTNLSGSCSAAAAKALGSGEEGHSAENGGDLPVWATCSSSVSTELCCHPFRCGRFLFMHNGGIGDFERIRRPLLSLLPDPFFTYAITNSSIDSVCLFALFLSLLPHSPLVPSSPTTIRNAIEEMINITCCLLEKHKSTAITLLNVVVTDGTCVVATKFVAGGFAGRAHKLGSSSSLGSTVFSQPARAPDSRRGQRADETGPRRGGDLRKGEPKSTSVYSQWYNAMLEDTADGEPDREKDVRQYEEDGVQAASLYFATGTWWQQQGDDPESFVMTHSDKRTDICIVTSEPLTANPDDWMAVPRNHMVVITPSIDLLLHPITVSLSFPPSFFFRAAPSLPLSSPLSSVAAESTRKAYDSPLGTPQSPRANARAAVSLACAFARAPALSCCGDPSGPADIIEKEAAEDEFAAPCLSSACCQNLAQRASAPSGSPLAPSNSLLAHGKRQTPSAALAFVAAEAIDGSGHKEGGLPLDASEEKLAGAVQRSTPSDWSAPEAGLSQLRVLENTHALGERVATDPSHRGGASQGAAGAGVEHSHVSAEAERAADDSARSWQSAAGAPSPGCEPWDASPDVTALGDGLPCGERGDHKQNSVFVAGPSSSAPFSSDAWASGRLPRPDPRSDVLPLPFPSRQAEGEGGRVSSASLLAVSGALVPTSRVASSCFVVGTATRKEQLPDHEGSLRDESFPRWRLSSSHASRVSKPPFFGLSAPFFSLPAPGLPSLSLPLPSPSSYHLVHTLRVSQSAILSMTAITLRFHLDNSFCACSFSSHSVSSWASEGETEGEEDFRGAADLLLRSSPSAVSASSSAGPFVYGANRAREREVQQAKGRYLTCRLLAAGRQDGSITVVETPSACLSRRRYFQAHTGGVLSLTAFAVTPGEEDPERHAADVPVEGRQTKPGRAKKSDAAAEGLEGDGLYEDERRAARSGPTWRQFEEERRRKHGAPSSSSESARKGACGCCRRQLPKIYLVSGSSDTSVALWDISSLLLSSAAAAAAASVAAPFVEVHGARAGDRDAECTMRWDRTNGERDHLGSTLLAAKPERRHSYGGSYERRRSSAHEAEDLGRPARRSVKRIDDDELELDANTLLALRVRLRPHQGDVLSAAVYPAAALSNSIHECFEGRGGERGLHRRGGGGVEEGLGEETGRHGEQGEASSADERRPACERAPCPPSLDSGAGCVYTYYHCSRCCEQWGRKAPRASRQGSPAESAGGSKAKVLHPSRSFSCASSALDFPSPLRLPSERPALLSLDNALLTCPSFSSPSALFLGFQSTKVGMISIPSLLRYIAYVDGFLAILEQRVPSASWSSAFSTSSSSASSAASSRSASAAGRAAGTSPARRPVSPQAAKPGAAVDEEEPLHQIRLRHEEEGRKIYSLARALLREVVLNNVQEETVCGFRRKAGRRARFPGHPCCFNGGVFASRAPENLKFIPLMNAALQEELQRALKRYRKLSLLESFAESRSFDGRLLRGAEGAGSGTVSPSAYESRDRKAGSADNRGGDWVAEDAEQRNGDAGGAKKGNGGGGEGRGAQGERGYGAGPSRSCSRTPIPRVASYSSSLCQDAAPGLLLAKAISTTLSPQADCSLLFSLSSPCLQTQALAAEVTLGKGETQKSPSVLSPLAAGHCVFNSPDLYLECRLLPFQPGSLPSPHEHSPCSEVHRGAARRCRGDEGADGELRDGVCSAPSSSAAPDAAESGKLQPTTTPPPSSPQSPHSTLSSPPLRDPACPSGCEDERHHARPAPAVTHPLLSSSLSSALCRSRVGERDELGRGSGGLARGGASAAACVPRQPVAPAGSSGLLAASASQVTASSTVRAASPSPCSSARSSCRAACSDPAGHVGFVECVVACGPFLCSGGGDGRVVVWTLRSGTVRGELRGHRGGVLCLSFYNGDPDGGYLSARRRTRRTRRPRAGGNFPTSSGAREPSRSPSRDGLPRGSDEEESTRSASQGRGASDAAALVGDAPERRNPECDSEARAALSDEGSVHCRFSSPSTAMSALSNLRDDAGAIVPDASRLPDLASSRRRRASRSSRGCLEEEEGEGGLLFSGSRDKTIRVWRIDDMVCVHALHRHTAEVLSLTSNSTHGLLVSGAANGEVFVWCVETLDVVHALNTASPNERDWGCLSPTMFSSSPNRFLAGANPSGSRSHGGAEIRSGNSLARPRSSSSASAGPGQRGGQQGVAVTALLLVGRTAAAEKVRPRSRQAKARRRAGEDDLSSFSETERCGACGMDAEGGHACGDSRLTNGHFRLHRGRRTHAQEAEQGKGGSGIASDRRSSTSSTSPGTSALSSSALSSEDEEETQLLLEGDGTATVQLWAATGNGLLRVWQVPSLKRRWQRLEFLTPHAEIDQPDGASAPERAGGVGSRPFFGFETTAQRTEVSSRGYSVGSTAARAGVAISSSESSAESSLRSRSAPADDASRKHRGKGQGFTAEESPRPEDAGVPRGERSKTLSVWDGAKAGAIALPGAAGFTRSLCSKGAFRGVSLAHVFLSSAGARYASSLSLSSSTCFMTLLRRFVALPSVSGSAAFLIPGWKAASFLASCFERLLGAEVQLVPTFALPLASSAIPPAPNGGLSIAHEACGLDGAAPCGGAIREQAPLKAASRLLGTPDVFAGGREEPAGLPVVLARLGCDPKKPTIVFYSHYDVVGAEFTGERADGADLRRFRRSESPASGASPRSTVAPQARPDGEQGARPEEGRSGACRERGAPGASRQPPRRPPSAAASTTSAWRSNPWSVWGEDGYVYGRGVSDNKGPILCTLFAVREFVRHWRRKRRQRDVCRAEAARRGRHASREERRRERGKAPATDDADCRNDVKDARRGERETARSETADGSKRRCKSRADKGLPFNFVWVSEGQEESGSRGFEEALRRHLDWIVGSRFFVICTNSYWIDDLHPCLVYGMRGVVDVRISVAGGREETGHHSGVHGGAVAEPMQELLHVVSSLTDSRTGYVRIPQFYDGVQPISEDELASLADIPLDAAAYGASVKDAGLRSADGPTLLRKRWLEPCLCVVNISSSAQSLPSGGASLAATSSQPSTCSGTPVGQAAEGMLHGRCDHVHHRGQAVDREGLQVGSGGGNFRIIPSAAFCDLCVRLVPAQDPTAIFVAIKRYVEALFREMQSHHQVYVHLLGHGQGWKTNKQSKSAQALFRAAHQAVQEVWGVEPLHILEGGSMPVVKVLTDLLSRHLAAVYSPASCMPSSLLPTVCSSALSSAPRALLRDAAQSDGPQEAGESSSRSGDARAASLETVGQKEKSLEDVVAIQIPLGQASDNAHLPNERIRIINLYRGIKVLERTLDLLAQLHRRCVALVASADVTKGKKAGDLIV
ncbi:hypothetical protein BESB_047100 [Besnoitia besnoiti]|uniref:Glutamine amidotransferase type-2 domain-containing protein n=1 Tax=Besnoitia besnoiti TaxID=94643 RepID=A0A2A9MDD9_BESBE|nr:hypothetical protein BESB_047100 [Besnoitia besnoiti]PFH36518.1 hypothetical protein BESB_047100 [Besnoitia besnoiti]